MKRELHKEEQLNLESSGQYFSLNAGTYGPYEFPKSWPETLMVKLLKQYFFCFKLYHTTM